MGGAGVDIAPTINLLFSGSPLNHFGVREGNNFADACENWALFHLENEVYLKFIMKLHMRVKNSKNFRLRQGTFLYNIFDFVP